LGLRLRLRSRQQSLASGTQVLEIETHSELSKAVLIVITTKSHAVQTTVLSNDGDGGTFVARDGQARFIHEQVVVIENVEGLGAKLKADVFGHLEALGGIGRFAVHTRAAWGARLVQRRSVRMQVVFGDQMKLDTSTPQARNSRAVRTGHETV
jgi:hypothetical protein